MKKNNNIRSIRFYILIIVVVCWIIDMVACGTHKFVSSESIIRHDIDTLIHPVKNTILIKGSGIHYNDDKSIGVRVHGDTVFVEKVQVIDHQSTDNKQFKSLSLENHKLRVTQDSLIRVFKLLQEKEKIKSDSLTTSVKIAKVVNHVPNFWQNLVNIAKEIKWIILAIIGLGILILIARFKKLF